MDFKKAIELMENGEKVKPVDVGFKDKYIRLNTESRKYEVCDNNDEIHEFKISLEEMSKYFNCKWITYKEDIFVILGRMNVLEICEFINRVFQNNVSCAETCPLSNICCNYSDYPTELMDWSETDLIKAFDILKDNKLKNIEKADIEKIKGDELRHFDYNSILEYLKELDELNLRLCDEIDYRIELENSEQK